ncbi:S-adenosyl-L-methionine-dependent methyltransferase [Neolentinus lepideus HHB14362 ss-1]|uniref:S-adenosyl-L-methionine-dependent methyltransferase n=1 Tax=Neolentinus lepideus HHB14362 ss-1 TaxID=1314782 RepID=A0A165PVK6_9AGAM|nr:S-adenosyl-L-methionine-dependent methyltransferase [Neolentinus lepideus HHB14362 ss-1]
MSVATQRQEPATTEGFNAHSAPIQHRERNYQQYPGSSYILPSDEEEQARLELQHRVLIRALGNRLVLAPTTVKSGDHVLDCGTGSGIWALDLAKEVPSDVHIQGIDIETRLFPTTKPDNAEFAAATATNLPEGWANKFALVNQRLLIAALKSSEWPVVLGEIHRSLAPGGWVQLLEAKRWGAEGPHSVKHRALLELLFSSRQLLIDCSVQLPKMLEETGYKNVRVEEYKLPAGRWAGQEGIDVRDNFISVFRGMKTPILKAGGLGYVNSEEEYDQWMDDMAKEWDDMEGTTVDICVCYAQKALEV